MPKTEGLFLQSLNLGCIVMLIIVAGFSLLFFVFGLGGALIEGLKGSQYTVW